MGRPIRDVLRDTARVYEHLQAHGPSSVIELSKALNLRRQGIYDHLDYLAAFFGDEILEHGDGRYALSPDAPLRLPEPDRRVLAIANQLLDAVGMPCGAEFEMLFTRIMGGSEQGRAERTRLAAETRRHLHFAEPVLYRRPDEAGLITRLYQLCIETPRRPVNFSYTSMATPDEKMRRIWPLGLVFNHAWYLVGYDEKKAPRVRTYALDRIAGLRPERLGKALELDFDLAGRMADAWRLIVAEGEPQEVVMRMASSLASARKHPSQEVVEQDGDEVLVRFLVSEPMEMVGFVLSHADQVEVVEPPALREKVVAKLEAGLRRWSKGAAAPEDAPTARPAASSPEAPRARP